MNESASTRLFMAPWGRPVTVVSVLVTGLLLWVPLMGVVAVPPEQPLARWPMVILPLLILAGTALFAVRGFALENTSLVVRRLLWSTRIPLEGLETVTIDPEAMKGSLRLAGNGGLFALTGLFRNKRLGLYRAFVTDLNRCVVLRLPKRSIVVSPDEPEEFAMAVRAATGLS
jgi:hypothetical protein